MLEFEKISSGLWNLSQSLKVSVNTVCFMLYQETNNLPGIYGSVFNPEEINKLFELGYTTKKWHVVRDEYPDMCELTTKGRKLLHEAFGILFQEDSNLRKMHQRFLKYAEDFYKVYPTHIMGTDNTGEVKQFSLKACKKVSHKGRDYEHRDGLLNLYVEVIQYDEELHREIIEKVKYAAKNNLIKHTIMTFVVNKEWETINIGDANKSSDWVDSI